MSHVKMIFQNSVEDCGYACIAMLLNYYGKKVSLNQTKIVYKKNIKILSAFDLCSIAQKFGLQLRVSFSKDISNIISEDPCILHWKNNHFVFAKRYRKNQIKIYDPNEGIKLINFQDIMKYATGFILDTTFIDSKDKTHKASSRTYLKVENIKRVISFLPLIIILLISNSLLFGTPLLIKEIINIIINSFNLQTSAGLIIVYLLAKTAESTLEYLKIYFLSKYGYLFNLKFAKNLMEKLEKLPIGWHTTKQTGEILNTISSVYKLNSIYVDNIILAITDGIISIVMSFILLFMSLSIFVFLSVAILLEYFTYKEFVKKIKYHIDFSIKQKNASDHILIENIRNIISIKINLIERIRNLSWLTKFQKYGDSTLKIANYKATYQLVRNSIIHLETLFIVILSAYMIKNSELSYGGFFLILFYKGFIHESVRKMFDKLFDYQFTEEHINNINYILKEEEDDSINDTKLQLPKNNINAVNISFQYPFKSELILDNFSYEFKMNKSYCIIGPSGCGKSTLLYLLLGLMRPTAGTFKIDGNNFESLNNKYYKSYIASVIQNDSIFSGTIIENISLFDPSPNLNLVKEVCEIACIDQYINTLPLTYNSFVNGVGNSMSGGQKQRILLARALYKQPKILFLDEATSHLDKDTEIIINKNIAELKISKIIVAHRLETIQYCDHVINLGN